MGIKNQHAVTRIGFMINVVKWKIIHKRFIKYPSKCIMNDGEIFMYIKLKVNE